MTQTVNTIAYPPLRILLVDDHAILRAGLRMLIEGQPGLKVVGEADNRTDALALAARERPDIILLDLDLGGTISLGFIPELLAAAPGGRILILTGLRDPELYRAAKRLGAMGVVLKEQAATSLLQAIAVVSAGESWVDSSISNSVWDETARSCKNDTQKDPEAAKIATLTKREREIIALVSEGLKNQQVADRLFISEGTVRNHLTVIFDKLGLSGRFELIIYAHRYHLTNPPGK